MKKFVTFTIAAMLIFTMAAAFKTRTAFFTDYATYAWQDMSYDSFGRLNPEESGSDTTGKAYHFIIPSGSATVTTVPIEARGFNWITYTIAKTDIGDGNTPQTFTPDGNADYQVTMKVGLHSHDLIYDATTMFYMNPDPALAAGYIENTSNLVNAVAKNGYFPVPIGGSVSKVIFDVSKTAAGLPLAATTSLMVRLD